MIQVPDIQLLNLLSIGHGNRSPSEFLRLLHQYEIDLLIDVRSYPYSRYNPQFRKSELTTILKNAGIEYMFKGEGLGGRPNKPELYHHGKLNYLAVKKTPQFIEGIKEISELVRKGIKVALMCSETNPNDCHRKHLLADEFIQEGFIVWHITKTGSIEKHEINLGLSLFD